MKDVRKKTKPVLFSDHFKIDKERLKELGIFNPILNFDTKLFVDPVLLKRSSNPIIQNSIETFRKFFADLLLILQSSKSKEDKLWREAKRRVHFPEYNFTCIGYGFNSTRGSGAGDELNDQILNSAQEIIEAANGNPDIFLLLPLLEEGVGADIVSDMTQNIIDDDICRLTVEVMKELGLEGDCLHKSKSFTEYNLLRNPYSNCPIKLLPSDILSQLPLADNFGNWLIEASSLNQELRQKVNEIVGHSFHEAKKQEKKETLLHKLKTDKSFFLMVLKALQEYSFEHYDLEKDAEGLHRWLNDSKELVKLEGFKIPKPKELNLESLVLLVESIIANFKQLIEEKELWRIFWTQRGSDFRHVKELYSQMLFYMVCESWLVAQNSDVSLVYESKKEFGKQLVFRFSLAGKYEVIVLVKNSDNSSGLELFYEKQVEFSKKEGKSFYVVMNFKEDEAKQLKAIKKSREDVCKIIEIDVVQRDEKQGKLDFELPQLDFDLGVIEFEGIQPFDNLYIEEKRKGGLNSHSKNKELRSKVEELCRQEIQKKNRHSALQLCAFVAKRIEKEFPKLLQDFEPYKKAGDDGGDWTKPTFYGWCNDVFKQAKAK